MRKTAALLLLVCSACSTRTAYRLAYRPRPDAIWPLVAQSHIIATGTLGVPVDHIRSCLASNRHEYAEIAVTCDEALKGNPPERFAVRWHTQPRDYSLDPERLIALDGQKALLFLVDDEGGREREYYFAGATPRALTVATADEVQRVRNEVSAQREMLARFAETFPPAEVPLYERVRRLIDATTRKDSQTAAFRELEELGPKAVPAIILLMDDRRDLAVPSITLGNHPGHWEAFRLYGPEKVVDAMAAILNQITKRHFGSIYNSGSERERQATVNGWRTYLYYWKQEAFDTK